MDYSDIIIELSKRYNELQKEFQSVQDLVNDIDFVFNFTEEEQWLFYRMRSTMEEHCGALLRLIRFLKKQAREESDGMFQTQHDPNFDDVDPEQKAQAMAMHHCGQDASRLVAYGDNLEQIIGARVRLFHTPGHKCEECPYRVKSDGSSCKYHKVELISGHFICLTPNPIITE